MNQTFPLPINYDTPVGQRNFAQSVAARSDEAIAKWRFEAAAQVSTHRVLTLSAVGRVGQPAPGYWFGRAWFTSTLGGSPIAIGSFTESTGAVVNASSGTVFEFRTSDKGLFVVSVVPASPATLYVWTELCGVASVRTVEWV